MIKCPCVAILTIGLLVLTLGQVRGVEIRVFPVSLNVEGEYQRTKIVLRTPIKRYGSSIVDLARQQLDAEETAFVRFAEAIGRNDEAVVGSLIEDPPAPPPTDASLPRVAVGPKTPGQLLIQYRLAFRKFDGVIAEGRIPLDDGALFLWRAQTDKGPFLRGSIVRLEGGKPRISEVTMARPVAVFLVNALGQIAGFDFNDSFTRAPARSIDLGIGLTRSGVRLEFHGDRPDVDLLNAKGQLPAYLLPLRRRLDSLMQGKFDQLDALHTAKSAAKLKDWLKSTNAEGRDAFVSGESHRRHVKLVIDGDGVVIVFVASGAGAAWSSESLQYFYLVRSGEGYRIANVFYESLFDDLIKTSPALIGLLRGPQ